jgi:hypothetical protein
VGTSESAATARSSDECDASGMPSTSGAEPEAGSGLARSDVAATDLNSN